MKANILNIQKTYSEIPRTWEFEGVTYQGYEHFTDLHFVHGWRDVVIPTITETQKLSNDFILINDIVTKEVIELTPEEIAEQQRTEAKINETEAYKKRTQDGINAYAEISAEFRLTKLSGIISEETQRRVERALIPVRNEVLAGQWISAKNELELLGSDSIGVDLYNRLHSQITNYINENY